MVFQNKVQCRLQVLIAIGEEIKSTKRTTDDITDVIAVSQTYVDQKKAQQWTISVLTILGSSIGENGENYK